MKLIEYSAWDAETAEFLWKMLVPAEITVSAADLAMNTFEGRPCFWQTQEVDAEPSKPPKGKHWNLGGSGATKLDSEQIAKQALYEKKKAELRMSKIRNELEEGASTIAAAHYNSDDPIQNYS